MRSVSLRKIKKMRGANFKIKFLVAGLFNVLIGYLISLFFYSIFKECLNIYLIIIFVNLLNITIAFFIHKKIVYRSDGNFWREYFLSYITYGGSMIISIITIPFLMNFAGLDYWLATLIIIPFLALFSYFGHGKITFR